MVSYVCVFFLSSSSSSSFSRRLSPPPQTHTYTHASPLPPPPQGRKGKPNLQPMKAFGIVVCAPSGTAPKPSSAASAMSGKAPPQENLE
ncbi:RING1 and YY1 binding protein [Columba livia]|uniref:RING1 and YY1 binding protein n=1 Tax=Columba livia TaxID=8932 RepID=A0A2I0M9L2_COLLI|nr:RING1 and YY1 binding protein [Columba livia]